MIITQYEERLHELVRVFLEENAVINLSAFRTEEACWTGNILDSLSFLDLALPGQKILDLGTGGGFPLLPLALCLPDRQFTGMDAVRKKIDAVTRIKDRITIPNVELVIGRSEELGRDPAHREQYDIVLARGVAAINVLLEHTSPFVKKGGHIVFWKSMTIDQELQDSLLARAELSCHLIKQYSYELPGDWGKRQLLVFQKASPISGKYPRAVGVPKKSPLL